MRDLLTGCEPVDLETVYAVPAPAHRRRPWHLRVNFVASVDGAVTVDGTSAGLGSAADKAVFRTLRAHADVVLVGAGTARAEGYGQHLPSEEVRAARRERGQPEQATVAVVTASADLGRLRLLAEDGPRPVVLTCTAAPAQRRAALAQHADVVLCGDEAVDLSTALAALADRGLTAVLCEGGPTLFGLLGADGLVDEVCLTTTPVLAGAGAGRIVAGPGGWSAPLRLAGLLEADGVLLARYRV